MTLTASIKDELSRLGIRNPSARKAEVSAALRFAGGLQMMSGRVVIQAEVDLDSTARRLQTAIAGDFGCDCEILRVSGGKARAGRYFVRVLHGGEALARRAGLLDRRGNPVRGLPPSVLSGSVAEVEALWRGAFLAQGSLIGLGPASSLGINCPSLEAALSLAGAARRLDIEAATRQIRGLDRVIIRDEAAISAMLRRMGAHKSLSDWQEHSANTNATDTNRVVSFDASNQRRSAVAAAAVAERVEWALKVLGDEAPDLLKQAGELRITHRHASLDELGQLADPPMSKDTVAGRIRRLLEAANRNARSHGNPTPVQ